LHPHEGVIENKILQFLKTANYQGIILFDDIWYFKTMRDNIWYKIDEEYKLDVTEYSHWSGCGIVSFNKEYQKAFQIRKRDVSNWTLVTAYFNLTKCFDASDEIKARDPAFYMNSALSTLSLPYNLVIFCDEESREEIEKMRPTYLKDKTVYNIRKFDEFSFVKGGVKCGETFADYRLQIIENRINHPYNFDNRNTASYYLFCMSRYAMLKEVISLNLFGSTHFAWINFCIEKCFWLKTMIGNPTAARISKVFGPGSEVFFHVFRFSSKKRHRHVTNFVPGKIESWNSRGGDLTASPIGGLYQTGRHTLAGRR
jgi:hypothetical protein